MANKRDISKLYPDNTALGSKEKFLDAINRIDNKFKAQCDKLQKEAKDLIGTDSILAAERAKEFLDIAEEYYVFKRILDMACNTVKDVHGDVVYERSIDEGDLN